MRSNEAKEHRQQRALRVKSGTESSESPSTIAVGSRNTGTIKRLIVGSVSSDVLQAVSGPLLVYRRPAG